MRSSTQKLLHEKQTQKLRRRAKELGLSVTELRTLRKQKRREKQRLWLEKQYEARRPEMEIRERAMSVSGPSIRSPLAKIIGST